LQLDLRTKLRISIIRLTASWEEKVNDSVELNNTSLVQTQSVGTPSAVQPSIKANKKVPKNSLCTVPRSLIYLRMSESAVAHIG
ncbi:hypothetical protein BDC45DRAFT_450932, partial [Circinella umbellata]